MVHFDHSKCVNKIHEFKLFGRLFHVQKATTWWSSIQKDGTERLSFFEISLIKRGNQIAHRWILFKYSITFMKI